MIRLHQGTDQFTNNFLFKTDFQQQQNLPVYVLLGHQIVRKLEHRCRTCKASLQNVFLT